MPNERKIESKVEIESTKSGSRIENHSQRQFENVKDS